MMRDTIVSTYIVYHAGGRVLVEDKSFRYWSVAEIVRRNQR